MTALEFESRLDELRQIVGRVDALASVALHAVEHHSLRDPDPVARERAEHLVEAVSEAATKALEELDQLRAELAGAASAEAADERS